MGKPPMVKVETKLAFKRVSSTRGNTFWFCFSLTFLICSPGQDCSNPWNQNTLSHGFLNPTELNRGSCSSVIAGLLPHRIP
jgi:hypothetical protein